ncbi:AAA family ATPase, partial [uncultured Fibrobacter sp.]|uniref:AAA family ATPase n=1 Tax=uncultured Fibrobacter sp. TaxID=261512 RepID=UPI0025F96A50
MTDEEILKKLEDAFNHLSKELNSIVVPFDSLVLKAGLDKTQTLKYEQILKSSGLFKLDHKDDGILVNRKNFKPMEKTMTTLKKTTNNKVKLHDRIKALRDALSEGLYEKETAVRLALLTAIAGESIFFLGEPGCAKSMIARRVVQAFKADGNEGIKYFETLLNAYTTPDEVFGNVSLKGLNGELPDCKDKEVYRRLTEGMLPEADIAFLDEIWKANSTILNSLLTIVNERKYHNGNKVENVPLKALFAASNELPAKGQGLEALYDRLVLRLIVSFIEDEDKFFDMVESPSSSEFELSEDIKKLQITNAELKEWKSEIDKVSLSEAAKFVIFAVRKEFAVRNESMSEDDKRNGELFEVGDRRWKKIVHILKTSAFLNDRAEVDLMDCQLIEYCIWNTEKQQKVAREIVEKCIQQNGLDCDTAIDEIKEQIEDFDAYITDNFYIDNPDFKKIVKETIDGEEYYKIDYDDNTKR